jgi:hypothetical protein
MNEPAVKTAQSAPDSQIKPPHPKLVDFLLSDYGKKVDYLTAHFTRIWTRFNFFMTLEAGLSAALWLWFKDKGSFADPALGITLIGLVSSLIWYIFGAQDRYLVGVYRDQIKLAAGALKKELSLPDTYIFVGDPGQPAQPTEVYQWRSEPFSTTRLAAWFPLAVAIYWAVMVVFVLLY